MYNLGYLGLYKNIPKKRIFNPTPDYERDSYNILQYKSHLRNEFLIPLKAYGDGTGVLTLRLISTESQSVSITGVGRFYSNSEGTLGESTTATIGTSTTTLYVKVGTGSCYVVVSKAGKLSGLGSNSVALVTETSNSPFVNGCNIGYSLLSLLYIKLDVNTRSFLTGSIDNTPSLNYLNLYNNKLSALTGSIDNTLILTIIIIFNNPLTALTGDIGKLLLCNYFGFQGNTASQLTYQTTRTNWTSSLRIINISMASMTSAMVDNLFIDIDASGVLPAVEKLINVNGLCGAVTSASATARANLVSKGYTVVVNT